VSRIPATLANLVANDNGLRALCSGCPQCVEHGVSALVVRYSKAMLLPEIRWRSRCLERGAKGGSVQVVADVW